VKNYPNQVSDFGRFRSTLGLIDQLNQGTTLDTSSDDDLGYELVRRRLIGFRNFPQDATDAQIEARIAQEKLQNTSLQAPLTTARELRRTLRNLGWIDAQTNVTSRGTALLASTPGSYEEQALLVEGLLEIAVTDINGNTHHPVRALLRLLAIHASYQREGLELALEPLNDTDIEFQRAAALYDLPRDQRLSALGISEAQRANAVKIFPRLAVTAGLVIEESHLYSLSQDGWAVLGQTPNAAAVVINKRRGRKTTSGRKVSASTVASRRRNKPPRTLSPEEQARAAARLNERTKSHQELVRRIYDLIGDDNGDVFEDEFSYDLLWVPKPHRAPAVLFEMKSVTNDTDAYARVRHAIGQLSYYDYFYVRPSVGARKIERIAAFDSDIPEALKDFLSHEHVGALKSVAGEDVEALNQSGKNFLTLLPPK
jgi:hypothetical protein